MTEIVYILTNEAMPGLVKVGRTSSELAQRIRALFQTGVPLPFELFYAAEVEDGAFVEKQLHDAFDDHRVSRSREFFRIAPQRVQSALSLAAKREVQLPEGQIIETPEENAEILAAKRRTRFQFSMIGMKPGSVLQLYKDPSITCTSVDERNKVDFRGNITSLSDAAMLAHKALGTQPSALNGAWEWTFEGKRLDDLRRELEELLA